MAKKSTRDLTGLSEEEVLGLDRKDLEVYVDQKLAKLDETLKQVVAKEDNFFLAIRRDDATIVAEFLSRRPESMTWKEDGMHGLAHSASASSRNGSPNAARLLLSVIKDPKELDAFLNEQDPKTGNTALHTAYDRGFTDLAKLLAEAGARPDIPNKQGVTVLKMMEDHCGPMTDAIRKAWEENHKDDYSRGAALPKPGTKPETGFTPLVVDPQMQMFRLALKHQETAQETQAAQEKFMTDLRQLMRDNDSYSKGAMTSVGLPSKNGDANIVVIGTPDMIEKIKAKLSDGIEGVHAGKQKDLPKEKRSTYSLGMKI